MTAFSRPYWRYIPAESDFTTLEDRLALSEIEMVGSTTQLTSLATKLVCELWAVKQNGSDLFRKLFRTEILAATLTAILVTTQAQWL